MDTGEERPAASVWELAVFRKAYEAALEIHRLAQRFPKHEQYELAKQLRDQASQSAPTSRKDGASNRRRVQSFAVT